jgi:hypothetical protein
LEDEVEGCNLKKVQTEDGEFEGEELQNHQAQFELLEYHKPQHDSPIIQ